MIETRGTGGYFLIAPSQNYKLIGGDWSSIPTICEEDHRALISLARTFDERIHKAEEAYTPSLNQDCDLSPGDDYDAKADVPALLKAHGWKACGSSGKYWTRPGKKHGVSASWNVVPDRLYVFSTSTNFEAEHVYRAWHVYAILECGGDFRKAAIELKRQGFGIKRSLTKQQIDRITAEDDEKGIEGIQPGKGIDSDGEAPTLETEEDKLRRMLFVRAFDQSKEPPPLRPLFSLKEKVICTPGNLTAISAQAKVGKSSFMGAMEAAAISQASGSFVNCELDLLHVTCHNEKNKGVILFDTEQSPDDFWHGVARAMRRAKTSTLPANIFAFTVADLPAAIARKAIWVAMADIADVCGGLHAVFIDGVADLCLDVNDAEECNGLVAELHSGAIRYDCNIISIIHKNPGSDKTRGHLGSQLERKAETNLQLDKDDQVTVVWSAKQRRAPIEKKDGVAFTWDEQTKMHVSYAKEPTMAKNLRELVGLVDSVFADGKPRIWKECIRDIIEARSTPDRTPSQRTAERWLQNCQEAKLLIQKNGLYQPNPKFSL